MTKCPRCFHQLPASPASLLCVGSCSPQHDDTASALLGIGVLSRPLVPLAASADRAVASGTCSSCKQTTNSEACPHCHYEIPPLWRDSKVTTVAMAGARTTGKSLLLASAIMQLELLAERQWRSSLEPIGSTQQRFADAYLSTLLEQRKLLQPTSNMADVASSSREPLIWRFTQRVDSKPVPRTLVLRDVAGEDLENAAADRRRFTFFSRADAVLLLVDPLKVPEIKAVLADVIPTPKNLGGDPLAVLNNALAHMTGHVPGGRTEVPVGLVLSKFDVMQKLRDTASPKWRSIMSRAGSAMQRDPSLNSPAFDAFEADLLHQEVRSLLHTLGAPLLESTLRDRTAHHRFFAASALGASPDDQGLHPSGISPFRVLDPIKWALSLA